MPTVLSSLNQALHEAMSSDQGVYLLGEDILDPYGGAFKVAAGLSTAFPDRVLTTPVSEAGVVGVAAGMALRGLRPVVEIMFGDFITLIADQVVNTITKFRWMYNDQVQVPMVIRTPMGGRRGYGPTHSQTLEKLFLGVPGLTVLAPTALGEPGELLRSTILFTQDPVLFIENKLLYLLPVQDLAAQLEFDIQTIHPETPSALGYQTPIYCLQIHDAPAPALTLIAYGYTAELARQAALQLAYEAEVFVELIVPTQLAPFQLEPLFSSLQHTRRLLVVEEGTRTLGWGAEILARTVEAQTPTLLAARRLAAQETPIPVARSLEDHALPGVTTIVEAARLMV